MPFVNKYQGLVLLRELGFPTISWQILTNESKFDDKFTWTIRTVKKEGHDYGLPVYLNLNGKEATEISERLLNEQDVERGYLYLYYPYFISTKTGTVLLDATTSILEAVRDNNANLTRRNMLDVSMKYSTKKWHTAYGCTSFFDNLELEALEKQVNLLRRKFNVFLYDMATIIAEWSFASYPAKPSEKKFLFQEIRMINYKNRLDVML
jgi:hypothetical protein